MSASSWPGQIPRPGEVLEAGPLAPHPQLAGEDETLAGDLEAFQARLELGDADHDAIKAAVNGDFSLLEAYLDEKNVPGWRSYVGLAKEAHANAVKQAQEADAKVTDAVSKTLEQFGYTNEQWGEAIQWVRAESPEDVPEINKLLSSGPLGARAITAFILSNHREASGTEFTPRAKAVKDEAGANTGAPRQELQPISKAEFGKEAEKLARSLGPDYLHSREYQQLRQRAGIGRR